ncbi:cupin domain-containing protein [Domibacillus indicus]|uniref:cupin domain-containing protein n=1 Tax=Domibacillus indicus TaxID=1437523 RepID=UPI000617CC68|nr:cupin domain-containing protein [Domibacillus indicus]
MQGNVKAFRLKDDGEIPNNEKLPVIFYEGIFAENPQDIEPSFNQHGWTNSWSGGVYDYHHYHTNTHEVLGVQSGTAVALVGGEQGERLELKAGDVLVLPAGTGHKRLDQSPDFSVIGAYPDGKSPNLKERAPAVRAQSLSEIANVPVPETDPVFGTEGPLLEKWKAAAN